MKAKESEMGIWCRIGIVLSMVSCANATEHLIALQQNLVDITKQRPMHHLSLDTTFFDFTKEKEQAQVLKESTELEDKQWSNAFAQLSNRAIADLYNPEKLFCSEAVAIFTKNISPFARLLPQEGISSFQRRLAISAFEQTDGKSCRGLCDLLDVSFNVGVLHGDPLSLLVSQMAQACGDTLEGRYVKILMPRHVLAMVATSSNEDRMIFVQWFNLYIAALRGSPILAMAFMSAFFDEHKKQSRPSEEIAEFLASKIQKIKALPKNNLAYVAFLYAAVVPLESRLLDYFVHIIDPAKIMRNDVQDLLDHWKLKYAPLLTKLGFELYDKVSEERNLLRFFEYFIAPAYAS